MLKSVVELLGVTRTISQRFEEVLEVNDFHKVFRLAKVEIVDVGSPKDVEETTSARAVEQYFLPRPRSSSGITQTLAVRVVLEREEHICG
ncbi:unnamed protein product [Prunus armeniaca]